MLPRRNFVRSIAAVAVAAGAPAALWARSAGPMVEVWKDPSCGCCKDWVAHLQSSGFVVRVNDSGNTAARARLGIPQQLGSCHTALVDGYAVEGHVPAREIRRLLKERPDATGLSVPGMPVGSPGMDAPAYGGRTDPFDVLLVQRDGTARVYRSYNKG